jgi:hypothetical protein
MQATGGDRTADQRQNRSVGAAAESPSGAREDIGRLSVNPERSRLKIEGAAVGLTLARYA